MITDKKNDYIRRVNIYRKEMPIWLVSILRTLLAIFLFLCILVTIFNFTHIGTPVIGSSMLPTLNNYEDTSKRDYVYINRFSSYTYGDIIVVNNPDGKSEGRNIIKRVIALEKDKIAIVRANNANVSESNGNYKILLIKNGETKVQTLSESYIPKTTSLYPSYLQYQELISNSLEGGSIKDVDGIKFLEINEGYVFYMGDNRTTKSSSYDCLEYGPVAKNKVVGKVDIIVYENTNHISYIFNHYINKFFS